MARIKVSESELKRIIRESVESVLNEGLISKTQPVTLAQLIKDIGYTGNVQNLVSRAGNSKFTPFQWADAIEKLNVGRNASLGTVYKNLAAKIRSSVEDRDAVAQGMKDVMNGPNADVNIGATGRFNPGAGEGMDPNGKPMTFNQIMNVIQGAAAQRPSSAIKFSDITTGSAGVLRGQKPERVKNTIMNQLKKAGVTLKQTNPKGLQSATNILTQWVNGQNQAIQLREVASALATIGKVLNPARNEVPVVAGFQRLLNSFGMTDAKGTRYAVDGVIGANTSAALKQVGYKDIYEYKDNIINLQKTLGVKEDGIVGNDTLNAIQQAGIKSFDELRRYVRNANSGPKIQTDMPGLLRTQVQNTAPQPTIMPRPGATR